MKYLTKELRYLSTYISLFLQKDQKLNMYSFYMFLKQIQYTFPHVLRLAKITNYND